MTTTTDGHIKAWHYLAVAAAKAQKRKPRYDYEPYGFAVHAKYHLNSLERAKVNLLTEVVRTTEGLEREGALRELRKLPVTFVPVQSAITIDRSRYDANELRHLAAQGGGKKERVRAARRAAAMQAAAPLALAA